jgi:UDP-glucose 4-epimerase
MRVLVTGGAGYVGSVVVQQLVQANLQVFVLDSLVQGHRQAVTPGAEFTQGDIGDRALVEDLLRRHQIEAVVHMAAATVIERSMTDPRFFYEENVVKGSALVGAMLDCNVRKLVFSSTAAVFGEPVHVPITEDHPKDPINVYGESKLMFERILTAYHQAYGLKSVCFRYFNAAGASGPLGEDHSPESHLIPLMLKAGADGNGPVKIFGTDYPTPDGTCIRDYIHVVDLAQAHLLALQQLDRIDKAAYNLGTGHGHSVLQLLDAAKRATGRDLPSVTAARRGGDPAVLTASPDLAKRELGWRPVRSDPDQILTDAWAWHQKHPHGYES